VRFLNIPQAASALFATEDPDLEDAPVVQDMGTIELRAFRCQVLRTREYEFKAKHGLHRGRISERSKKAGWHHVRYYIFQAACPNSHLHMILINLSSTGDEVPDNIRSSTVELDVIDPRDAPFASIKVFYRPRGESFSLSLLQPS
jgi:hypothetical protein